MRKNNNALKIPEDFSGYYKTASTVIKVLRFFTILAFVVFAVFCIGFFKDNITGDNVRYLFKYIDLSGSDNTPSDAEIQIGKSDRTSFLMLYNDLAAISDTGIALYDFAGNKLYNYEYTYSDAAAVSNGKSILVYDTKGTDVSLYSSVSKVFETKFDYYVRSACINSLGCFAVVNSEKTYRSGIIVYDRDFNEIFRWMSPDKYVTGVAINANASKAVCTAVYNENGMFVTDIYVFDTSTGDKLCTLRVDDALSLKVGYADNDSVIYMLTDEEFMCFDGKLNKISSSTYNPSNAKFFRVFDECFALVEGNNLAGSSMNVKAYGYDGNLMFQTDSEKGITDVCYKDGTLFVLSNENLAIYDYSEKEKSVKMIAECDCPVQYKAVLADSYGRYVLVGAKKAVRGSLAALLEKQMKDNK